MANQSFDTTVLYPLERPLSSDLNAAQSELHRELRDYLGYLYSRRASSFSAASAQIAGYVSDGFRATPGAPGLAVNLTKGMGFAPNPAPLADVNGVVGLNDLSSYSPLLLSDTQPLTLNAAPGAGFARVDLIQAKVTRRFADVVPRDQFNAGTLTFGSVPLAKTMTFDLLGQTGTVVSPAPSTTGIGYKVGTTFAYPANDFDSATALAARPAVDAGYVAIAYINVRPSVGAIVEGDIIDMRPLLFPGARIDVDIQALLGPTNPSTNDTPAIVMSNLPPGMTMNVAYASVGTQYDVYLFGGDASKYIAQPYTFASKTRAASSFYSWANHDVPVVSTTFPHNITAAEQAVLANPALAAYAQNVAIGQPCFKYRVAVFEVVTFGAGPTNFELRYQPLGSLVGAIPFDRFAVGANTLGVKLTRGS